MKRKRKHGNNGGKEVRRTEPMVKKRKLVVIRTKKILKLSDILNQFNPFCHNNLTVEEMVPILNQSRLLNLYRKSLQYNRKFDTSTNKNNKRIHRVMDEERDIVTSLDIDKRDEMEGCRHDSKDEKYKDVLQCSEVISTVKISRPWRVGLIINLAKTHNLNGTKKKKIAKVKSLTIVFITKWSIKELLKNFNNPELVPYTSLKNYCGMLSVGYYIEGFETWEDAKNAFILWKHKTRNSFSRLHCGYEIFNFFKQRNPKLIRYSVDIHAVEFIKRIKNSY